MRHNKKFNHLGRTASHRSAMLSNMACSLIKHKRITTTVAKAKALKKFVEPLITKSKDDTTNSRRVVFSNLQDKFAVLPSRAAVVWYIPLMDTLTASPTTAIPIRACLIGLSTLFSQNFRVRNLSPIWDLPILDTVGIRPCGECAVRFVRWI